MMEGLSINNIDITNEDVLITYTPSTYVTKYSYEVFKDGKIINQAQINSNIGEEFVLSESGTYQIIITTYDINNNAFTIKSGDYKIDKDPPKIALKEKTYKITTKEEFDFLDGVEVFDNNDGDLTNKVETNITELDFKTEGIKRINYSITDNAGNVSSEIVYVTVVKDNTNLVRLAQVSLISIVIVLIFLLFKYIRGIKLEKRFSKFSLNSYKNTSHSLFDNLYNKYAFFLDKFSKILNKSTYITNRAIKYDKYVEALQLLQSKIIAPYEIILYFLIGFYSLDFFYLYKYILYKKKIENDLLDAITVMNNAFKSGRSIIQAIDLVALELDGPISKEFKKISMELSFGLDIEVAFKRFSERIKSKDAVYLTSSLAVLNKTGGNIIKVFDSIEKTLFSRRKLQVELKSLTSSSRFIMYILIFMPIVFAIFISMVNKNYFQPLFSNALGLILIAIMFIIYISYIIVVKKVMKVRM